MNKSLILLCISCLFCTDMFCCTSAIITGKLTRDGRPLMWKHRDTGEENNRIEFIKGQKYDFLALVNSPHKYNEAWTGINNVGFCIMNTASYNLKKNNVKTKKIDREGALMFKALSSCRNLEEFEEFLDNYPRPIGVEANFGIIDAEGGAAYYEVNDHRWTKVDVNDPKIAPQGYLVYTNYSYTGCYDEGAGYIRHTTADKIIKNKIVTAGEITPEWIFKALSRSFHHSLMGIDLIKDNDLIQKGSGWFVDQDFIPRKSSTASIVIEGVRQGENPLNTVMWTVLGYPPVSVAVPLFIAAGENQPAMMLRTCESQNAPMCDLALCLKRKVFSITRGNGKKYLNFNLLYNKEGVGYMQVLAPVEKIIFSEGNRLINKFREEGYDKNKLDAYYRDIFREISTIYGHIL